MLIFQIFAVMGMATFLKRLKANHRSLAHKAIAVLLIVLAINHAQQLFTDNLQQQQSFKVGFDEVVQQVEQTHPDQPVAIVDPEGYHYILLAWYLRLSPQEYFTTVVRQQPDLIGFRYGEQLANYHFIVNEQDRAETESILVQWADNSWQIKEY